MKAPIRVSLKTVLIGTQTLSLYFDASQTPTVGYKEKSFRTLYALIDAFPQLAENFSKSAELANFLMRGMDFQLIEDIEAFKLSYHEQLASNLNENDDKPHLADYGHFDLSSLHPPRLNNGQLVFFVKGGHTHLPYQVSVSFPMPTSSQPSAYSLLPFRK